MYFYSVGFFQPVGMWKIIETLKIAVAAATVSSLKATEGGLTRESRGD